MGWKPMQKLNARPTNIRNIRYGGTDDIDCAFSILWWNEGSISARSV